MTAGVRTVSILSLHDPIRAIKLSSRLIPKQRALLKYL
jgi:hypothetical protein